MRKALNRYLIRTLEDLTHRSWYITDSVGKKRGFNRSFLESDKSSICVFQLGKQEEYYVVPITSNHRLVLNCIHKLDLHNHDMIKTVLGKVLKQNTKNYER
jgi:hypothetical protein